MSTYRLARPCVTVLTIVAACFVLSMNQAPGALAAPDFRFPWDAPAAWMFTGGPHVWGSYPGTVRAATDGSGLDFQPPSSSDGTVLAAAAGKITFEGWLDDRSGNVVKIDHGGGWETWYLHLSNFDRAKANHLKDVPRGFPIAVYGGSGSGAGPNHKHLHIELMFNGQHFSWNTIIIDGWTVHTNCGTGAPSGCAATNHNGWIESGGVKILPQSSSPSSVVSHNSRSSVDDPENRTIASGQTLSGAIDPANDQDTFYFDGGAGKVATIRMTAASGSSVDSYLSLYSPSGQLLNNPGSDDDRGGGRNALIDRLTLPSVSGRFKIVAASFGGSTIGAYTLNLSLSTPGCTSIPTGQYCAEYYNNPTLSGGPTFIRNDAQVNFGWGTGGPGNGLGTNQFSVRWQGRFNFSAGSTVFKVHTDDGVRVWVDGSIIIDHWQGPWDETKSVLLSAAGLHTVKVEYSEGGGDAFAKVWWEAPTCSSQYKAEYYNNKTLSGSPTLVQCENWPVDHDWGSGSPGYGVPSDNFSARWTSNVSIAAGTYTFIAKSDDGIRVWVDGTLIIDKWIDRGATEDRVNRTVSGGNHAIKVEYYDAGGGAVARLRWEVARCTSIPTGQYCAEYYNNQNLSGAPTFVRNDPQVSMDWGNGGPGNGLGSDQFSVRWQGKFTFDGGIYAFQAHSDDGIRAWIDGSLIVNHWQGPWDQTINVQPSSGTHTVKVEYYEGSGLAFARLTWAKLPCQNQYRAEYFNNQTLSGSPTFTRCESWPINFDWNTGGPGNGLGVDHFSVRWTGTFRSSPATLTFRVHSDDGIRIWINGTNIVDHWQGPWDQTVNVSLTGDGLYTIKVEYYEGGGRASAKVSWSVGAAAASIDEAGIALTGSVGTVETVSAGAPSPTANATRTATATATTNPSATPDTSATPIATPTTQPIETTTPEPTATRTPRRRQTPTPAVEATQEPTTEPTATQSPEATEEATPVPSEAPTDATSDSQAAGTPTVHLSARRGQPGATLEVRGSKFSPGDVSIAWDDGTILATVEVGDDGDFTASVEVPNDASSGRHKIVVVDSNGRTVERPYSVRR